MKNDSTHISVILDRTGSMQSIRDDTIGGFNAFLAEQKAEEGSATLTLVQFDSQDPYEVIHKFRDLKTVPELTHETFVPRAATPLLDALGRGINDLEHCLARINQDDRPKRVIVAIITDGQENASREFRKEQIQKMIKDKNENDDWQFLFLSADLSAIDDAKDVGISEKFMMVHDKNTHGTAAAWGSVSARIADYRGGRRKDVSYKDEDRALQESEKNRP